MYGANGALIGANTMDPLYGGTAVYALGMHVGYRASVYCYGGNGGDAYTANTNGGAGRYGLRLSPLVGLTNYGYVYCKGGKGGAGNGTGKKGSDYAPANNFIVQGTGTFVKENA